MRCKIFAFVLAICSLAAPGRSEELLHSLENGFAARPWAAVGRLEIGDRGFCTAVLIAEDLVLTAAHCLFDRQSRQRIEPTTMRFRAGWRRGHAAAVRGLRRTAVHPDFDFSARSVARMVRNDLALLELDTPIRVANVKPLATGRPPRVGEEVSVVSYAQHRDTAPSLQEDCTVVHIDGGVLVTSCTVGPGSSGSPIFVTTGGQARVVALVSAMAEMAGAPVALGTDVHEPLTRLKAALAAQTPSGLSALGENSRVRRGGQASGAKFVRPPQR